DFSNADLTNASFVSAVMQKSLFSGADLRGANLFRADLSQSRIDGSTKIDGAYTRQTKTLPRTVQEKL
ncbi:pentapeptide repeat-containing protein, partial [Serratia ureilytica]